MNLELFFLQGMSSKPDLYNVGYVVDLFRKIVSRPLSNWPQFIREHKTLLIIKSSPDKTQVVKMSFRVLEATLTLRALIPGGLLDREEDANVSLAP
jgi:hypothetical protein